MIAIAIQASIFLACLGILIYVIVKRIESKKKETFDLKKIIDSNNAKIGVIVKKLENLFR